MITCVLDFLFFFLRYKIASETFGANGTDGSLCFERKESQNERVAFVSSTLHSHLSLKSRSQLAPWTQLLLLAAGITQSGPLQLGQGLVALLGSCSPVPFGWLNRSLLRVCDIHYPQHHNPHVPKTLRSLQSEHSSLEDQKQDGRTRHQEGSLLSAWSKKAWFQEIQI